MFKFIGKVFEKQCHSNEIEKRGRPNREFLMRELNFGHSSENRMLESAL